MTIDEVSFVRNGANQRAHVLLTKADQGEAMPTTTDPYGEASVRYADAVELSKSYDRDPGSYDRQYGLDVRKAAVQKSVTATMLAEVAKSDDPKVIAKLLNDHPQLYDALVKAGA